MHGDGGRDGPAEEQWEGMLDYWELWQDVRHGHPT